jgi:hypothetical protein
MRELNNCLKQHSDAFEIRDGVFRQVPYSMKEKTVQITPPDSFLEMLNTLPE